MGETTATGPTPSWSLVVATYKRPDILRRCLRLAAAQTRPPVQVVVVDASPDWEACRAAAAAEFAESFPGVPLDYVGAETASLTAQRNQGAALARGEILFLLDDDSLMYPDCAAEIVRVYAADPAGAVAGVMAVHVAAPPDAPGGAAPGHYKRPERTWLRRRVGALLGVERTRFLPYDGDYPRHELPPAVAALGAAPIRVMAGFAMTFRRGVVARVRFSEVLTSYAAGEDQDFSYRASRLGALVVAPEARLCHFWVAGARLSDYQVAVLAALNPAVLQQFHSPDRAAVNRRWRGVLVRRLLVNALKDLSQREFTFARSRGVVFALRRVGEVQCRPADQLAEWYRAFQADFLAGRP